MFFHTSCVLFVSVNVSVCVSPTDGRVRVVPDRARLLQRLCNVCGHAVPVFL